MNKPVRNPIIGVMGASQCSAAIASLAEHVGKMIAEGGATLLCGGRSGVMEAAARGAALAGGLVVGVLPGRDAHESPPNQYVHVPIFTGLADGRNWINACSSDAMIAIAGGYGTLSEIALALKLGRPVALLESWSAAFDGQPSRPYTARDAPDAVQYAFTSITRSGADA